MSERPGRAALIAVTVAYVVALGWAGWVMPERIPSHFDASGRVDAWSSRASMLVTWIVLGVVMLAGIGLITRWSLRGEARWLNLPKGRKEYWLAPERRAGFVARFTDDMDGFAAMTGALLIVLIALTTWVGVTGRDALPGWTFVVVIGSYLALVALWSIALLRRYRVPPA